jgi:hypothetical protein
MALWVFCPRVGHSGGDSDRICNRIKLLARKLFVNESGVGGCVCMSVDRGGIRLKPRMDGSGIKTDWWYCPFCPERFWSYPELQAHGRECQPPIEQAPVRGVSLQQGRPRHVFPDMLLSAGDPTTIRWGKELTWWWSSLVRFWHFLFLSMYNHNCIVYRCYFVSATVFPHDDDGIDFIDFRR